MKIILCDPKKELIDRWKVDFAEIPEVEVYEGSVFKLPATQSVNALVSPANSFGFMDGGFDYLLSQALGWHVQERLQKKIAELPEKELLVGQAITIETNHPRWPYLIPAPTMRVPMILGQKSVNVYLASLAIFNELNQNPNINSIAVTGLGTGVGKVPVDVCSHQMRKAYATIFLATSYPTSWHDAQTKHQGLCLIPATDLQIGNSKWN